MHPHSELHGNALDMGEAYLTECALFEEPVGAIPPMALAPLSWVSNTMSNQNRGRMERPPFQFCGILAYQGYDTNKQCT